MSSTAAVSFDNVNNVFHLWWYHQHEQLFLIVSSTPLAFDSIINNSLQLWQCYQYYLLIWTEPSKTTVDSETVINNSYWCCKCHQQYGQSPQQMFILTMSSITGVSLTTAWYHEHRPSSKTTVSFDNVNNSCPQWPCHRDRAINNLYNPWQ